MEKDWTVIYVDENGERQVALFDAFEEADMFLNDIRSHWTCVIGLVTTAFYNHYVNEQTVI